jgi:hypothetical protein
MRWGRLSSQVSVGRAQAPLTKTNLFIISGFPDPVKPIWINFDFFLRKAITQRRDLPQMGESAFPNSQPPTHQHS